MGAKKNVSWEDLQLGDLAKDKVSGYTGVIIARTLWLYGCERFVLQSREMKDGKPVESCSFDGPQLELVKTGILEAKNDTGGPRPEPSRGR